MSTDRATAPARPVLVPGPDDDVEERVREQAGDDGGDAGHDVDEERHQPLELAVPVLDEVDRGEQANRHGDDRRAKRDEERAPDRVQDAARGRAAEDAPHGLLRKSRLKLVLAVRVDEEPVDAARDHGDRQPHERDERDRERAVDEHGHAAVDELAARAEFAKRRTACQGGRRSSVGPRELGAARDDPAREHVDEQRDDEQRETHRDERR